MRPAFANTIQTTGLKLIVTIVLPPLFLFSWSVAWAYQPPSAPNRASQQQSATEPKAAPQQDEWRVINPSDALATFQMPKKPRYVERTFTPVANKPPIKVHLYMATVNEGKATYIFGYNDLHEAPQDARTRDKALEGAVRGSVVNVQGTLLSEVTKIRFKKSMGRQFHYRYMHNEKPYVVISRVFIVGKRQYQISALSLESALDETLVAAYLNSFKLVTIENDEPPVPRTNPRTKK